MSVHCVYPCLRCVHSGFVHCVCAVHVGCLGCVGHVSVAVSLSVCVSVPQSQPWLPAVVPSSAHHELVIVREADVGDVRRVPKVPLVFGLWDRTAAQGWHQAKLSAPAILTPRLFHSLGAS